LAVDQEAFVTLDRYGHLFEGLDEAVQHTSTRRWRRVCRKEPEQAGSDVFELQPRNGEILQPIRGLRVVELRGFEPSPRWRRSARTTNDQPRRE
jgi:hypothetical protein